MKEAAAHKQHHKVKRRALQLMALPLLADGDGKKASQPMHVGSAAEIESGAVESGADTKSAAQHSTALEEFQALQKQLRDTQHPEVCTPTVPGKHAYLQESPHCPISLTGGQLFLLIASCCPCFRVCRYCDCARQRVDSCPSHP